MRQIAEDLAKENSIIRYNDIGVEKRGISYAKNYGAQLITGDYTHLDINYVYAEDGL